MLLGSGFLPYVLLVMLPGLGLSIWAAWRVRSTYARWNAVDSGITMNPFDFARYLLNAQGLTDVSIEPIPGQLTDHYDPRAKVLRVSSGCRSAGLRRNPRRQVGVWPTPTRGHTCRSPRSR